MKLLHWLCIPPLVRQCPECGGEGVTRDPGGVIRTKADWCLCANCDGFGVVPR